MIDFLTTIEAAKVITEKTGQQIKACQVTNLCKKKKLESIKKGNLWLIDRLSAETYRREKPGIKKGQKVPRLPKPHVISEMVMAAV